MQFYSVSQKNPPPWNFLTFFARRLGMFSRNFTRLLYVPIYAGLQIFIQLSATLTKLCHIKRACASICAQDVRHRLKRTLVFSVIFPKQLAIFSPTFTQILNIHMHARMQIFIQHQLWRSYAILSATTQRAFRSTVDILSKLWWSRLIWHNFVKVAVNWIKKL